MVMLGILFYSVRNFRNEKIFEESFNFSQAIRGFERMVNEFKLMI